VNDQAILTCAEQAAERLRDRRVLERHAREPATLLCLSVSEIAAIIDKFDALKAVRGGTLDGRVLRADLVAWIGGSRAAQSA
jgi:hypothetical protein